METNKKIYLDKLFPKFNNVILDNIKIDDESVSYITTPNESKKISEIIVNHIGKFKKGKDCTIIDTTAGVGGDTITFSFYFNSVVSIEINSQRFEMLKNNINEYKIKNALLVNGDSIVILPKISYLDIIYVDPPWGGKDYKTKDNLKLKLGDVPIESFIIDCFDINKMLAVPKIIALKLPKNYDLKHLYDELTKKYDIYLYQLRKINILIIEKKI